MRVGINLLYLLPGVVGGTETYARSLLRALAELDHENEYLVFLNSESADLDLNAGPNFAKVHTGLRASSRSLRYAWEQTIFPRKLSSYRLDVLHSLGYVGPFRPPCAHVLSIPDVNYHGQGDAMSLGRRALLSFFVERSARNATRLFTISEFSRGEIVRYLGIPAGRITVTHLAPRARFGILGARHRRATEVWPSAGLSTRIQ
jgi:hypothetical protein